MVLLIWEKIVSKVNYNQTKFVPVNFYCKRIYRVINFNKALIFRFSAYLCRLKTSYKMEKKTSGLAIRDKLLLYFLTTAYQFLYYLFLSKRLVKKALDLIVQINSSQYIKHSTLLIDHSLKSEKNLL